ncbi:MAG: hypothetical protein NTV93_17560 [Verrucomicrobia bacterium]|nr:hypothetical protein [Verrucomicrobiota bacterium]
MKSIFLVFGSAFGILLLAAGLCPSAQASQITVTITGTGTGTLNSPTLGVTEFFDTPFVWTLTYDSGSSYKDSNTEAWGTNHAIFLNATSKITVEGVTDPIHVTQEHGLWVYDTFQDAGFAYLYMAPVFLANNTATGNILTIQGSIGWTGFTTPYESRGPVTGYFSPFIDLATDQGLLTMTAGSITSVTASAGGTPYSTWVAGITWNGGDSAATADPDHDGLSNLMEYALGGNPVSAQSAVKPQPGVSGQKLQISFLRARSELTYTVQGSSNLISWTDIAYTPVATGNTQTVTDTVTLTGNARRFLRLQVTLP